MIASPAYASFRRGLRDTLPLVPPIAVFGVAFGALAVQAGLSPWLALGLRHLPMSATLSDLVGHAPWWRRLHRGWVLVDETFGLTVNASHRGEPDLVAFKTAADLTLYSTWLATTAVGAWLGAGIDPALGNGCDIPPGVPGAGCTSYQ